MAQQEGGWPLGLQPLNVRIGHAGNHDFSGSFSTLTSGSPTSSSDSSSDLDTESTGSFFHDRSITLGSLIGINSILELSSRSFRSRRREAVRSNKRQKTSWTWFSLCAKVAVDGESTAGGNAQSLGHFLEVERRANNNIDWGSNNRVPITYELDGLPESQDITAEPNSLFSSDGCIAAPKAGGGDDSSSSLVGSDDDVKRHCRDVGHANVCGIPLRFPCMGGCTVN